MPSFQMSLMPTQQDGLLVFLLHFQSVVVRDILQIWRGSLVSPADDSVFDHDRVQTHIEPNNA